MTFRILENRSPLNTFVLNRMLTFYIPLFASHMCSCYSPAKLGRVSVLTANWVMTQVCQNVLICFSQPMLNFEEPWKDLRSKLKLCLNLLFKIKASIKPTACELFTTRTTKWWHFPENMRKTFSNLCSAYTQKKLKLKENYAGKY